MNIIAIIISISVITLCLVSITVLMVSANNLVAKRNRVEQCRSSIAIITKQRNELIPNLLKTIKMYMGHEHDTLVAMMRMQEQTVDKHHTAKRGATSWDINALLHQLKTVARHIPELQANEQFLMLQQQLIELEEELQAIRRTYNAAVVDYNNSVEMFPSSIVARRKGCQPEPLLYIPQEEVGHLNIDTIVATSSHREERKTSRFPHNNKQR